jgi:hypothetical protein
MTRLTLAALTLTLSAASMTEACDRAYRSYPHYRPSYPTYNVYSYSAPRVHRVCPYPLTRETYVLFREHPILIERFPQEAKLLEARFGVPAVIPAAIPGNPPGGPAAPAPFAAGPAGIPADGPIAGGIPPAAIPQLQRTGAPLPLGGPAAPTPDAPAFQATGELAEPLPPADAGLAVAP